MDLDLHGEQHVEAVVAEAEMGSTSGVMAKAAEAAAMEVEICSAAEIYAVVGEVVDWGKNKMNRTLNIGLALCSFLLDCGSSTPDNHQQPCLAKRVVLAAAAGPDAAVA
uniref:Uncharacterized protein n=1 Tax=Chrysotila carterae TaxID=13221 RepID=A0A7S4C4Q8_CHRCT|mmetsp:Transcript_28272/g.61900  ORF Transcript_28272/g.61900 Transcript_28272/m.61900 type:complete len:109 (-) Transcript_28272:143-469(-)